MKEKYPVLIGHSARACKKLFTMEQVADFICEQGLYGEVTIETPEGLMLISTIQRDGKDFTFKYPAFNLGCNAYMDYHSWDMPAKDRENFRNMFEEGSRFYPQEITAISYRGKTIYEAEPWRVEDIPDEDETNTMRM